MIRRVMVRTFGADGRGTVVVGAARPAPQGWAASLPAQLRSDSGLNRQTALHAPGQVEHEYWLATAQYVPKVGSVKPPDCGQLQFTLSTYATGWVVHTVAASFQARHALESPALYG